MMLRTTNKASDYTEIQKKWKHIVVGKTEVQRKEKTDSGWKSSHIWCNQGI